MKRKALQTEELLRQVSEELTRQDPLSRTGEEKKRTQGSPEKNHEPESNAQNRDPQGHLSSAGGGGLISVTRTGGEIAVDYWIPGEPTTPKEALVSELRTELEEVRDLAEISPIDGNDQNRIVTPLNNIGSHVARLTGANAPADSLSQLYAIHDQVHNIAFTFSMGHLEHDDARDLAQELEQVPGAQG